MPALAALRAQAVLTAVARHLGSYAELGAAAAAEYRTVWKRRFALALLGAAAGMSGAAAAWVAGLVALWDTPWRLPYAAGSAVLLLVAAAAMLHAAFASGQVGPAADVLRAELGKDRELFEQWKQTHS